MAINEQHRQLEVARELEAAARTLAQPTSGHYAADTTP